MSSNKPVEAIIVTRAQIPHAGHGTIIQKALDVGEKVTIVIGSRCQSRTPRNFFTYKERIQMYNAFVNHLFPNDSHRIGFKGVYDEASDDEWIGEVMKVTDDRYQQRIIGFEKDDTSYYLNMFPTWGKPVLVAPYFYKGKLLNSTEIRNEWLQRNGEIRHYAGDSAVPLPVVKILARYTEALETMHRLYKANAEYMAQFADYPFPQALNAACADALVVCSGHIVAIRREDNGKIALPGGHMLTHQTRLGCAIAELHEETDFPLTERTLRRCVTDSHLFDDPNRSSRPIRTETMVYRFDVDLAKGKLAKLTAGDDAAEAFWLPLSEIRSKREEFHDDHFLLISHFLNV